VFILFSSWVIGCHYRAALRSAADRRCRQPVGKRQSAHSMAAEDFACSRSTYFWILPVEVFGSVQKTPAWEP
jgi:hypothetical protein